MFILLNSLILSRKNEFAFLILTANNKFFAAAAATFNPWARLVVGPGHREKRVQQ